MALCQSELKIRFIAKLLASLGPGHPKATADLICNSFRPLHGGRGVGRLTPLS
jgi:hypothetical protein